MKIHLCSNGDHYLDPNGGPAGQLYSTYADFLVWIIFSISSALCPHHAMQAHQQFALTLDFSNDFTYSKYLQNIGTQIKKNFCIKQSKCKAWLPPAPKTTFNLHLLLHIHLTHKFFKHLITVYDKIEWQKGHHQHNFQVLPNIILIIVSMQGSKFFGLFLELRLPTLTLHTESIRHDLVHWLLVFLVASEHN